MYIAWPFVYTDRLSSKLVVFCRLFTKEKKAKAMLCYATSTTKYASMQSLFWGTSGHMLLAQ
jgi:hypothetical protein